MVISGYLAQHEQSFLITSFMADGSNLDMVCAPALRGRDAPFPCWKSGYGIVMMMFVILHLPADRGLPRRKR